MGDSTSSTDTGTDTDAALGDAGKRALEAERKARRDAEARANQALARVRELELGQERRDVAAAKGLTVEQAAYLTGDSREALEAAADGLLAAFGGKTEDKPAPTGKSRPKESLLSGASGAGADDRPDMGNVADQVLRSAI